MAEHRVYVASIGVATVVTAIAAQLTARSVGAGGRVPSRWTAGLVCLLAVCAALTVRRTIVWDSPVRVWQEGAVNAAGMWEPHYALADALRESGDCARAVAEYERFSGCAAPPGSRYQSRDLPRQLGRLATPRRRSSGARDRSELCAGIPTSAPLLEGDTESARDFYQRAIEVDPATSSRACSWRASYETVVHDYDGAVRMCGEARAIAPFTPASSSAWSATSGSPRRARRRGR